MPTMTTGYYRDGRDALQTFVVETSGLALFAFEADGTTYAKELIRSGWLKLALNEFLSTKRITSRSDLIVRAATDHESSLYAAIAAEFAETRPRFLVAYLPGWNASARRFG